MVRLLADGFLVFSFPHHGCFLAVGVGVLECMLIVVVSYGHCSVEVVPGAPASPEPEGVPKQLPKSGEEAIDSQDLPHPRYGKLLKKYYPLLDVLVRNALPEHPPWGRHQYRIWISPNANVCVDMRCWIRVEHKKPFHQKTFYYGGKYDINQKFQEAFNYATDLTRNPPPEPRRPRNLKAKAKAAPAPPLAIEDGIAADNESEANPLDPESSSSSSSDVEDGTDTSSSHWGDSGLGPEWKRRRPAEVEED